MRPERRQPAPPAPERAPAVSPPPRVGRALQGPLTVTGVIALQRQAGNAAVRRLLQRHGDHEPEVAAPAGPALAERAPASRAQAEAVAAETMTRINIAIRDMAKDRSNPTARNTAELYQGSAPRLRALPMTPRSDSETIRAARGQPPGSVVYFFVGVTQPPLGAAASPPAGTVEKAPNVMGTIPGGTVVIRGQYPNGSWRSNEDIKATLIHEASHILIKSYGEFPQTDVSASSFDRYRDEFRAYFVQQWGTFAKIKDLDQRAAKIREHLVGERLGGSKGYSDLREAYWKAPADSAFRAAVDAHKRPDGFNLTNSIRLDALASALGAAAGDRTTVDAVMEAIDRLTPAECVEARSSRLITKKADACGAEAAKSIRAALDAGSSPRIGRLYEELSQNDPERIRAAFDALQPDERGRLQMNPATFVFVDRNVPDPRQRACVYAMLVGRSSSQYQAIEHFLDACALTSVGVYGDPASGMPSELRAAVARVTLLGRMALYRMVEDARKQWVDSLPDAVAVPLLKILRGDVDP